MMAKANKHDTDTRKTVTRVICLVLAAALILTTLAAAVFSHI